MRASENLATFHRADWVEGYSLKVYKDPGSKDPQGKPWTVGIGHTGSEVVLGETWMPERVAEAWRRDVALAEETVNFAIGQVPTTQGQFDAMLDQTFNAGRTAFLKSTLLRKHLAGLQAQAADEFLRWDKNDGQSMHGLRRRCAARRALYLGATAAEALATGWATP
jgi:lysozyme